MVKSKEYIDQLLNIKYLFKYFSSEHLNYIKDHKIDCQNLKFEQLHTTVLIDLTSFAMFSANTEKEIRHLNFSSCGINCGELIEKDLLKYQYLLDLIHLPKIETIDFSNNNIQWLSLLFQNHSAFIEQYSYKKIVLKNCNLTIFPIALLSNCLKKNAFANLEVLDLSYNKLDDKIIDFFCLNTCNKQLVKCKLLDISNNLLTFQGICNLIEKFSINNTVEILKFSNNIFSAEENLKLQELYYSKISQYHDPKVDDNLIFFKQATDENIIKESVSKLPAVFDGLEKDLSYDESSLENISDVRSLPTIENIIFENQIIGDLKFCE